MILDTDYKLLQAVSNSTMKDFVNEGPKFYFDNYIDPLRTEPKEWSTENTDIGDLVDCMVTTPKLFDKYYYVSGDVKVSDDFRSILDKAWTTVLQQIVADGKSYADALKSPALSDIDRPMPMLTVIETAREHIMADENGKEKKGYRNNYGDDALGKYIRENGTSYWKDMGTANGRKIIDQTTFNVAVGTMNQLMEDEITGLILTEKSSEDGVIEIQNQVPVTLSIDGTMCKILPDYVRINHDQKLIYPRDIKTATSRKQFMINYYRFAYGQQGAFYSGILQARYPDYTIAPFEFIVACTDAKEEPMIYRMSDCELNIMTNGASLKSGKTIPGWRNTLKEIAWHEETGQWRFPKAYYESSYVLIDSYNEEGIESINSFQNDDIF